MRIKKIRLSGFVNHHLTEVNLPERGIVLISGPNGSGKSTIIEGASWGLFGKTLRGQAPVGCTSTPGCDVETDAVFVSRCMTGDRTKLIWAERQEDGELAEPVRYDTMTKAQEALNAHVGRFEIWRRAHVFSSSDAAHFSMATAGERQRLLEAILGLEQFDPASQDCRDDLREAVRAATDLELELTRLEARLEAEQTRWEEAREALAMEPEKIDTEEVLEIIETIAARCKECESEIDETLRSIRNRTTVAAGASYEAKQFFKHLEKLGGKKCPTCHQMIPQKLVEGLESKALEAQKLANAANKEADAIVNHLESQEVDLQGERALLIERRARLKNKLAAAKASKERIERAERIVQEASLRHTHGEMEVAEKQAKLEGLTARVAELKAVDQVLGLKGVRAHVLGRALVGLESVGSRWLERFSNGKMSLMLSPQREKKTGGRTNEISLHIEGAGGGDYRGCSLGQRRRIDLAVLFALGEMATSGAGLAPGTLFIDEAADSLDVEGVAIFEETVRELSRERCVVVISHREDLARVLNPEQHLRVLDGQIVEAA